MYHIECVGRSVFNVADYGTERQEIESHHRIKSLKSLYWDLALLCE